MLVPPRLPPFLADMFDLKPIEGVPSDGEVKLVHATIRSLNEVLHIPSLYDPDLANTTYTPPQLPAHIPVSLESVSGAPSKEQIKYVQAALRLSESLANVPSMFSQDLSMDLSQHLFDIQFERYLRRAANREFWAQPTDSRGSSIDILDTQGAGEPVQMQNVQNEGHHGTPTIPHASTPPEHLPEVLSLQSEVASLHSEISQLKISIQDARRTSEQSTTQQILAQLRDGFSAVQQILIGTQHSMARGINSWYQLQDHSIQYYSLVNAKGEIPENVGLPSTWHPSWDNSVTWVKFDDYQLAHYLRFYGIGEEYIQQDGQLTN